MDDTIFEQDGKFYFLDETGDYRGPYKSRRQALRRLKGYTYWLDHGPTLWQRIYWGVRSATRRTH